MKMKVFIGEWFEAMDAFNNWAKGKNLTRDVIIQTSSQYILTGGGYKHFLTIAVIHPDDPFWDRTETKPIPAVQPKATESTRVECEAIVQ